MYAILVQKTDDMKEPIFHIEDISITAKTNLSCFLNFGHANPFSLIGTKETFEDAEDFIKQVKKQYNFKFSKKL